MKDKKKTGIAISIVLVAVIVIVAVAILLRRDKAADTSDRRSSGGAASSRTTDIDDTAAGSGDASSSSRESGEELDILESLLQEEGISEPTWIEADPATLSTDDVQGFVPAANANGDGDADSAEEPVQITLSDNRLQAEGLGRYAGSFLEDGSDEATENVVSLLVKNNSDQMLQVGEITFQVNDSETATFFVTNLPAGASGLVLESNKRPYSEEDSYTYGDTVASFIDSPSLEEDKFEIAKEDGKLTLKNNTEESYEKIYVYYKYKQRNGTYMGGITYRTPFENVAAGSEVEAVAAHFRVEGSEIVDVRIQQVQTPESESE